MKSIFRSLMALFFAVSVSGEPQTAEAAGKPKVLLKTNKGDITIELEPGLAPITVANFLDYVRSGHYDGKIFHRVIKAFMIQGGGFSKDYQRSSTNPPIQNEADKGLSNERGTIAMARTGDPHSATDQFFINVKFNGFLNHRSKTQQGWGYTAFGRVIDGMNIAGRIARAPTGAGGQFQSDVPVEPIFIEHAKVVSE